MTESSVRHDEAARRFPRSSGRDNVTLDEARAAARLKVKVDRKYGRTTEQWIVDLADS